MKNNDTRLVAFVFISLVVVGCIREIVKIESTKLEYKIMKHCAEPTDLSKFEPQKKMENVVTTERELLDAIPQEFHMLIKKYSDSHFQFEKTLSLRIEELDDQRNDNLSIIKCYSETIKQLTKPDTKEQEHDQM